MRDAIRRVEEAIEAIRQGKLIILVDDEDRENEGDLCIAAEKVTPEAINFMAKHGRGLICLSLTDARCEQLGLPMMVPSNANRSPFGTAFTVSIEARHGVTTGISAADRAVTIRTAIASAAKPSDLIMPGHVFPLRAQPGGVLVRTGQTEGSVDLARLAGLEPAGVICEILNDDGTMARMPDLETFGSAHGLSILSIADLITYRLFRETLVEQVESGAVLPGLEGVTAEFESFLFASSVQDTQFLAMCLGKLDPAEAVLVRVHSACIGDPFNLRSCPCGATLRESLKLIQSEGRGVLLYVLPSKFDVRDQFVTHVLQQAPRHELQPDHDSPRALRGVGLGIQVLLQLGLRRIRLLSNNPKKIAGLAGYGIEIVERVPVPIEETRYNEAFLNRKRQRGELVTGEGKKK
ncbi:MAG: 3,4-dihydroxy-2-butanone-4-phosphate synthase [Polyangia bacterium]|nr:3,4-dihydroxy-2-butanone-4-phosphate synthase [Polyangia bacterium]